MPSRRGTLLSIAGARVIPVLLVGFALAAVHSSGATASSWAEALEHLQAGRFEDARPLLETVSQDSTDLPSDFHTAQAYVALHDKDPAAAWRSLERGILRERAPEEELLELKRTKVLLSGANAALIVYSRFEQLDPICMVVYPEGEYAVSLPVVEGQRRSSWLRDVWPRIPKDVDRLFIVPPFVDDQPVLGFEEEIASLRPDDPLGPQLEVSYLVWSSLLQWTAPPRTRSGDGLTLVGSNESEAETILGGQPRNAPLPVTEIFSETAADSDVLHLMSPFLATAEGLEAGTELWSWDEVATHKMIADLVVVRSDIEAQATAARAFHLAGVRSTLVLPSDLGTEARENMEQSLYLLLRRGLPRDQIPPALIASVEEAGANTAEVANPAAGASRPELQTRLWGPGHLPVYALVPKRGLGSLVLSWVIFLATGFVVIRFGIRRYISNPGPTTLASPRDSRE